MFHPEGPTFWELTVQALSSTIHGYDRIAPKFEYTPFRTPDALLNPLMQAIGEPESIDCALDVCCGTGAVTRLLKPLCRDYVAGIDFSEGMLEQARTQIEAAPGQASLRLIHGDVMAMDFDQEFDAATSCGAFGHILPKDHDQFIAGIFRALKPGGRFVCLARDPLTPRQRTWWLYKGFNAVMHVRNAIIKPEFVMYYLNFHLPRALAILTRQGFHVEVQNPFDPPFDAMRIIVATRPVA